MNANQVTRSIILQLVVAIIYVGIAYAIGGEFAAISALLGAMSYVLPNIVFNIVLAWFGRKKDGQVGLGAFLGLEVLKLVLAIGFIVVSVKVIYADVSVPYFLIGLVIALKTNFVLLLRGKS